MPWLYQALYTAQNTTGESDQVSFYNNLFPIRKKIKIISLIKKIVAVETILAIFFLVIQLGKDRIKQIKEKSRFYSGFFNEHFKAIVHSVFSDSIRHSQRLSSSYPMHQS
jgi:hypothetical protein